MSVKNQAIFWGLASVAFILFIYTFKAILMPFVIGIALAYFLNPPVTAMTKTGLSRTSSGVIILGGFFTILSIIGALLLPVIAREAEDLSSNLPQYGETLIAQAQILLNKAQAFIGKETTIDIKSMLSNNSGAGMNAAKKIFGGLAAGGKAVLGALTTFILTPIVAFFMIREWDHLEKWVQSLMPRDHKNTIMHLLSDIDKKLSGFVRGQISVAVMLAVGYAIALSIAGLKYSVLIGLTAGLLSIIPMFGSIAGLLISVLVAWFQTQTWGYVAMIAGIFLIGQFIEGNILSPKIIGDRVGLHPLWVFFALMAGGSLFGILGMLLAVPVAAVVGVLGGFAITQYKASAFYKKTPVKKAKKKKNT